MKTIPIIIPYFKEQDKLKKCIEALKLQRNLPIELYIRDNTNDNILFTKAINEGLRKYCYSNEYDFSLILNQDAYLRADCLNELIDTMNRNQQCGIACPIQLTKSNQATWYGSLNAYPAGIHAPRTVDTPYVPFDTFWANGACMLIRNSMIREIGLLDENMLFICSDSDYSFTARSRGWSVMVVPSAEVEHTLDASGNNDKPHWLIKQMLKDQIYFANKWLTGDLYRSLSYEGEQLTNCYIESEINKSISFIDKLNELMV